MAQQEILTGRIREPVIEHDEPALPRLVGEDFRAWLRVWGNGELADNSIRARDAVWLLWSFAGLRATTLYRLAHEFRRRRVPLVPGMLWRLNITLHGFDVPPSVPIVGGLYVPHPV